MFPKKPIEKGFCKIVRAFAFVENELGPFSLLLTKYIPFNLVIIGKVSKSRGGNTERL